MERVWAGQAHLQGRASQDLDEQMRSEQGDRKVWTPGVELSGGGDGESLRTDRKSCRTEDK